MTAFALNNLWTYLQGLALARSDREWLASKLIEPEATAAVAEKVKSVAGTKKRRKVRPLSPEVAMLSNLNLRECQFCKACIFG